MYVNSPRNIFFLVNAGFVYIAHLNYKTACLM